MIKKAIALIMTSVLCLFCLVSCSEGYPPVASTEKEAEVIMTVEFGEKKYDVKYELYRALFLTLKSQVDGGDSAVWDSAESASYEMAINALIVQRLTDIFSVFSIADEIGIDVYSDEYDEMVKECIIASVDGGAVGTMEYQGFDGDYDAYLASLKEMYLNYSVQDLFIRYALAVDDVYYYYTGNVDNDAVQGKLSYTKDDVKSYYDSDACVRVKQLFLSTLTTSYTKERANEIRDSIASAANENAVFLLMINHSALGDVGKELEDGTMIGRHNLDPFYYGELTAAAFALNLYETSEVIEITTSSDKGFFILYRTDKSDSHFEECYEEIEAFYVEDKIGEILDERALALKESLKTTDVFTRLEYSKISMEN